MRIIDNLFDIQKLLHDESDYYDLKINLLGTPVSDRYPLVGIRINDQELWDNRVINDVITFRELQILDSALKIEIVYKGKTDQDTVVNGETILENQSLTIESIEINDVKIQKKDLMYMGVACYELTESQKNSYAKVGASWIDVKTNVMYNNGTWKLEIKKPILSNLIDQKQISNHIFEVSHYETLDRLQRSYLGQD